MVIAGHLIALAVLRMTYEEARRSIPELTEEQWRGIRDGRATFTGNSEEGIEYIEV